MWFVPSIDALFERLITDMIVFEGVNPNAASPLSLRNVPFAIHVGGNDAAYQRNEKAAEWGMRLETLAAADPGGYVNQWEVHAVRPHWMELDDAASIPFLQSHTRDPIPRKVVWRKADVPRATFYWLAVDAQNRAHNSLLEARYAESGVTIDKADGVRRVMVRLSDAMLDLDRPVTITRAGSTLSSATVTRTIGTLAKTLGERNDPALLFPAEVTVDLP